MPTKRKGPSELYRLIWRNDVEGVRHVLKAGEDINARDAEGRTPLMEAIIRGSDEMVELLVRSGADPNLQDQGGFSALHFASQDFKPTAAETLLLTGAKVDLRDSYGNTPLWRALFNSRGRGDMVRLLLHHGADPLVKNNSGKSPLDLAKTVANYDLMKFFPNARDS